MKRILVMGVSGTGKTTIGKALANHYQIPFLEGDDFHPRANVDKMSNGIPLQDEDRWPWLKTLANAMNDTQNGYVVSCSALKEAYRQYLKENTDAPFNIIFLEGDAELISSRMQNRKDHYMPESLLQSQFNTLEVPTDAIAVSIDEDVRTITNKIIQILKKKSTIGLLGLGVMGKSLARNLANNKISTLVYNLSFPGEEKVVDTFIDEHGNEFLTGAKSLETFIAGLDSPRQVLLMIKAGDPVDEMIEKLIPLLDKGDTIIDAGNSFYKDTRRRSQYLDNKGLHFVGMGVSGGEEGALKGPAIMPAGSEHSKKALLPELKKIAAVADGIPCVNWVGPDGAGHYVKMIHNGIEYADMQILTEAYAILKRGFNWDNEAIADEMSNWKATIHNSYLLDITINILSKKSGNEYILDTILDVAGHKGTGMWTTLESFEMGVPAPTIVSAMNQRILSSYKDLREELDFGVKDCTINQDMLPNMCKAMSFPRLIALIEGFHLLIKAGEKYAWNLNLQEIAQLWRGGCIIRSDMLLLIREGLKNNPRPEHLLQLPEIREELNEGLAELEKLISAIAHCHLAIPAISNALNYYKSMTTGYLPINLIQAQRDYFGAHTYRTLGDRNKAVHTIWKK